MMKLNNLVSVLRSRPVQRGTETSPSPKWPILVSSGTLNPSIPPPPSAFCRLSHAGRTFYQTYNARRPCLSSGFCTCVEQFAVIRQECAVADDVPSWSEDCTFSVVVRSSLGDHNCTTLQLLSACGHLLSALLAILFLVDSDCAVPLQCLWHESVTLISTCLIIIIIPYHTMPTQTSSTHF